MPDACQNLVIVNERAGGGAALDHFRRLEHALWDIVGPLDVCFTEHRGHGTILARDALKRGVLHVLVVGGDGTVNEVVNGWLTEDDIPISPDSRLVVLGGGTGSDLRRSLGLRGVDDDLRVLKDGSLRTLDLGRVTCRDCSAGGELCRLYLNVASLGLSGAVVKEVADLNLPGHGVGYFVATVRALWQWKNVNVRMTVDDAPPVTMSITTVAVANGRYFGGGMKFAPDACPDDGLLNVTALVDFNRLDVLALVRTVYDGGHIYDPRVYSGSARVVQIEPLSDAQMVRLDIDGEAGGCLPARFEVLPGAVKVVAP